MPSGCEWCEVVTPSNAVALPECTQPFALLLAGGNTRVHTHTSHIPVRSKVVQAQACRLMFPFFASHSFVFALFDSFSMVQRNPLCTAPDLCPARCCAILCRPLKVLMTSCSAAGVSVNVRLRTMCTSFAGPRFAAHPLLAVSGEQSCPAAKEGEYEMISPNKQATQVGSKSAFQKIQALFLSLYISLTLYYIFDTTLPFCICNHTHVNFSRSLCKRVALNVPRC